MSAWREPLRGKRLVVCAVCFTLLFGLLAHGFRFFRLDFAHDATMVYQCDAVWQIRLGRYLMPVYAAIRGQLVAPAWVGILSLSFLALAVWLVCDLLGLRRPWQVALCAGVMSTHSTLVFANAAYLPWSDIYMLALLFAVGAVWLWRRCRWGFIPAMALLCASVALYAAYVQAAVFLMLAALALELLDPDWDCKRFLADAARALGALVGGLGLYAASYAAVLAALGLRAGAAPNSVTHIADLLGGDLPALLGGTYGFWWKAVWTPQTLHAPLVAAVNLALLALAVLGLVLGLKPRGRKLPRVLLLVALAALAPLGVGCIYLLTAGQVHDLMAYPMCLGPVACLALWGRLDGDGSPRWTKLAQRAVAAGMAVILFCAAAYANQVYLKQALDADNTRSVLTRVLDRVEQTPGYVPGQTPVALVGGLQSGPLAMKRPGFDAIDGTGVDGDFSVTYYYSYDYYFSHVLGYPMALCTPEEAQGYAALPQVQALEPFPAQNCTVLLPDGTLALRLS